MSETPRTDAVEGYHGHDDGSCVPSSHARELERELAVATAGECRRFRCLAERTRLERENAALREALDFIAVYDFDGPYCPGWKGAARQMQEWACSALGIAKPWDHPNFSAVALRLTETLPPATDPLPARGGGQHG